MGERNLHLSVCQSVVVIAVLKSRQLMNRVCCGNIVLPNRERENPHIKKEFSLCIPVHLAFRGAEIKSKKIRVPSASYFTTIVATARFMRAFCVIPKATAIFSSPSLMVSGSSTDCLGNSLPPHSGARTDNLYTRITPI